MAQSTTPQETKRMTKSYKFAGYVIRLSADDYDEWSRIYHGIPDIMAELYNLDLFYNSEVEAGKDMKNWFFRTSSYLNRKHQEYLIKRQQAAVNLRDWKTDGPIQ